MRALLLLRKDLRVLRRSPLLLVVLLAYPLLVAGLVGLVAGYASSKPRVALVDEDNLPATLVLGGHRFHVDRTIDQVSRNVKLIRMPAAEANRELASGRLVAVITIPHGFLATLKGLVASPRLNRHLRGHERLRVGHLRPVRPNRAISSGNWLRIRAERR